MTKFCAFLAANRVKNEKICKNRKSGWRRATPSARLGTRLEQRFTRGEIELMMHRSGLESIRFSDDVPFWVAIGRRAA